MRNRSILATLTALAVASVTLLQAQNSGQREDGKSKTAQGMAGVPDLSGMWGPSGKTVNNWFPNDSRGQHPEQAPMTPWAKQRFEAARPPFGANQTFEGINDPVQKFCDTPGVSRLYLYPWQFTFVQTPDTVYLLYEYSRVWRSIAMNQKHPQDPDPTWLGDSVGRYEGDTLVIDTIGFNDKTWLDHLGHPHSEALHLIERFRRIDHNTLELQLTVDDPKAYTKVFTGTKTFSLSSSPMSEGLCSMSESEAFQKNVIDPATKK
jgi:hypothetical protein